MEAAMTRLALVLVLGIATVGCVTNGPYCDEDFIARCDQRATSGIVAVCTTDGEPAEWATGEPDGLRNGMGATCNAGGNVVCRTRDDWTDEQNAHLVLGCACLAGADCDVE